MCHFSGVALIFRANNIISQNNDSVCPFLIQFYVRIKSIRKSLMSN